MGLTLQQQHQIKQLASHGVTDHKDIIAWCKMYIRMPAYPKKSDYGATRRHSKQFYQGIVEALS